MNKDISKRIDNCFEVRKNLWTSIVVLTGSIVALTLNIDSFIKFFWISLGAFADFILIYSTIKINENIEKLLNKLEEEEK
ncbi:MAG: hypothetical protein PHC34_12980 [Candidatus Gastranaerophilales bacterium]|nr:hypothetical protein [Candidatus Gastranaerophilales bacterium]